MINKIFLVIVSLLFYYSNAQVGIGTINPKAKLEIKSSNGSTPLNTDGILIPKISSFPVPEPTGWQDGMLVFFNGNGIVSKGFYYWDALPNTWKSVTGAKKINDLIDGKSDSFNSSVFLGLNAGFNDLGNNNSYNVGVGFNSLYNNSIGSSNVAIGYESLFNNGEIGNTAVGFKSLYGNYLGRYNTALGYLSSFTLDYGEQNTSVGSQSLKNLLNGSYNTALGTNSLLLFNSGLANTAVGTNAISRLVNGFGNTSVGMSSMFYQISGNYNTALGYNALYASHTASYNTALGANAYNSTAFFGSTAVGYNTYITSSNQVRIGSSSTFSIGGFANWTNVSDKRFKKNIKENVKGLDFILKLRPVTYQLDLDKIDKYLKIPDSISKGKNNELIRFRELKEKEVQTGFIAQEVEKIAQEIEFDFSGIDKPKNENDYYGLRYAEFVVPLVKAIQEQQKIIQDLKDENLTLIKEFNNLKLKLEEIINNKNNQKLN